MRWEWCANSAHGQGATCVHSSSGPLLKRQPHARHASQAFDVLHFYNTTVLVYI